MKGSGDAGFTLLEVLIAVFVISIYGAVISQIMTESSSRMAQSNRRVEALRHAESMTRNLLSDARNGNVPELGITDGVVGDDHEEEDPSAYLWQMEVDEYEIDLPKELEEFAPTSPIFLDEKLPRSRRFPVMRRVEITVHRTNQEVEDGETFSSYLVEPTAGFWEGSLGGGTSGRRSGNASADSASGDDDQGLNSGNPRRRPRRPEPVVGNRGEN